MERRVALRLLAAPCLAPHSALPAAAAQAEWRSLFNGRDLTGWNTFLGRPHPSTQVPGLARHGDGTYVGAVGVDRDPHGVFTVVHEDGAPAIRISGETYGALVSAAEYADYHLRLQFKWGDLRWPPRPTQPRDTGCCYHSVGPYDASYGFWMRSFEFQIQEGDVGDFFSLAGVIVDVHAAPVDVRAATGDLRYDPSAPKVTGTTRRVIRSADVERPRGAWNTLELHCFGDSSMHVVNGHTQVVLTGLRHRVDGRERPLTRGRLQLQSEGAEVFFRDIAIRPIGALPAARRALLPTLAGGEDPVARRRQDQ